MITAIRRCFFEDDIKSEKWVALFIEDYPHGAIRGWSHWWRSIFLPLAFLFGWGIQLVFFPQHPGMFSRKRGKWDIAANAVHILCLCTMFAMSALQMAGTRAFLIPFAVILLVVCAQWVFSPQTPQVPLLGRWGRFIVIAAAALYALYIFYIASELPPDGNILHYPREIQE